MSLEIIVTDHYDTDRVPDDKRRVLAAEMRRRWRAGVPFSSTGDRDEYVALFKRAVA